MMPTSDSVSDFFEDTVLTDDQRHACVRLLALARVRAITTEAALPTSAVPRWSVPLLIGPSGVGKEHVCREVARRLGHGCCRRWEAGAWVLLSNRTSGTTLDQIEEYIDRCARGCVIYLSGIDALRVSEDRGTGWHLACLGEIERFLDGMASRPARFTRRAGNLLSPRNVLVVAGGRFAGLWGEHEPGSPTGAEAWKGADTAFSSDARAVAAWLSQDAGLPTGLLRGLAAKPLLLRRPDPGQAERLAARLRDGLTPAFDGLEVSELGAALQSAHGWRAVAALVEQTWVDGHEGLFVAEAERSDTAPAADSVVSPPPPFEDAAPLPPPMTPLRPLSPPVSFDPPSKAAEAGGKPPRFANRLGLTAYRSTLLPKARRLGLASVTHLEALAVARGYALPGDAEVLPTIFTPGAWRQEFCDEELAVALLSPGLDYSERALCRGALVLRRVLPTLEPAGMFRVLRPIHKERVYAVVRHIVRLALRKQPPQTFWRTLLSVLPQESPHHPALPTGVMPDEKLLVVLGTTAEPTDGADDKSE